MAGAAGVAQRRRDVGSAPGDGDACPGTSGAPDVTNGGRVFWRSYAVTAGGVFLVSVINVLNRLQEARTHRVALAPFIALLQEFSSTTVIAALIPLIWMAGRRWPPALEGWMRVAAIHLACATAFSVLHVAGMVALRALLPPLQGRAALDGLSGFFYEYRKDVLSYAVLQASGLVLAHLLRPPVKPVQTAAEPAPPEPLFDIKDGPRLVRTPVRDMVAVVSAGNYVEVKLADGRSPLMRATLAAIELELAPYGFVRTHRSWLVNPARVRVIAPSGSGDHRLELDGGLEAPLSRRYAQALETLRRPT